MQEKILDFLRKRQEYASGEEISQRLGISRQALWKHIHELKGLGYDIVAVPHLGYKLISCPDRLYPSEINQNLQTRFVGKKIYYFDTVTSTMDVAFQLGLKNSPEGAVILAETQTKGRGRINRDWFSPHHKGIYLSVILRPRIAPSQAPIFTLLVAVSVCEAIKNIAGLETQIKWPNDILLHNKKIGGILTEMSAEMDEIHFIIIGIGINVNNDKKSLVSGATSIKEHKKEKISRIELLQKILKRIEENYTLFKEKGGQPIIERWRDFNVTLGRRVKIYAHKGHIEGEAVDIDIDGALLLRSDHGLMHRVTTGDVIHCR